MGNIDPPKNVSAMVTLSENGCVVIPEAMRAELGLIGGERMVAYIVDGKLVIETVDAAIRSLQNMVKPYAPEGVSLVDELIAERHAEAERE